MSKDLYDHKTKCKQCGYELPVPKSIRNPDVGSEFCSCQCRDVFQSEQEITRLRKALEDTKNILGVIEAIAAGKNQTEFEMKCIYDEATALEDRLDTALSPAELVEKKT